VIDNRRLLEILVVAVGLVLLAGGIVWINWVIDAMAGSR
jgi:hypothetical protein